MAEQHTREEWLKERMTGIGGSEASAVIGMNPYMTNVMLWELKTGRREAEDISEKPFVKYGTEAEPHLRALFALDYPEYELLEHEEFKTIPHPEYDFIRASLDGELIERETGRKGILEIKTTNILASQHKEKWNDQIPQNYYVQVLHYMLVTGAEFAEIFAALRSEWDGQKQIKIRTYHIERADVEKDIEFLKQAEIRFWKEHVEKDVRPNLILPPL